MKNQTYGVEIEMANMSRERCAQLVQDYFNQKYGLQLTYHYVGNHLNNYQAYDHKNRKWNVYSDGSLRGSETCELVTPIMTYEDIEDLQAIVRMLRNNGAISNANYGCGVHIHIGANIGSENGHNAKTIRNLVNIIASHQNLIKRAIDFTNSRSTYCQVVSQELVRRLNARKPKTMDELKRLHYDTLGRDYDHYSHTRYYFLNLHAIWDKGTIEFRCFEFHKSMHAGELKAYIQLCLAMSSYSKIVRYARPQDIANTENEKYTMNSWLKNMGLIGDEFKTARKMLTKRLNGDTAYRNGRVVDCLDDLSLD